MTNVFDVAKYIINKLGETDTWKLQKLVYYAQAWSLVWEEKPLFPERIEAWANGPVCPDLYEEHKGMFSVSSDTPIWGKASLVDMSTDEISTIDAIIRDYGHMKGYDLRALTHLEEPWKQARVGIHPAQRGGVEITHEMMRLYYGSL